MGKGGRSVKRWDTFFFFFSTISGSSDLEPEFMGSNFRFTSWMSPWCLLIYPTGLLPERQS